MTVDKLDDFCATYEISLRLHGTEGTIPAEKVLKTLQPVKTNVDQLLLAKDSGYKHQFSQKPSDFQTMSLSQDSMVLQWSLSAGGQPSCFDGFYLVLYDAEDGSIKSQQFIDGSTTIGNVQLLIYFMTVLSTRWRFCNCNNEKKVMRKL